MIVAKKEENKFVFPTGTGYNFRDLDLTFTNRAEMIEKIKLMRANDILPCFGIDMEAWLEGEPDMLEAKFSRETILKPACVSNDFWIGIKHDKKFTHIVKVFKHGEMNTIKKIPYDGNIKVFADNHNLVYWSSFTKWSLNGEKTDLTPEFFDEATIWLNDKKEIFTYDSYKKSYYNTKQIFGKKNSPNTFEHGLKTYEVTSYGVWECDTESKIYREKLKKYIIKHNMVYESSILSPTNVPYSIPKNDGIAGFIDEKPVLKEGHIYYSYNPSAKTEKKTYLPSGELHCTKNGAWLFRKKRMAFIENIEKEQGIWLPSKYEPVLKMYRDQISKDNYGGSLENIKFTGKNKHFEYSGGVEFTEKQVNDVYYTKNTKFPSLIKSKTTIADFNL